MEHQPLQTAAAAQRHVRLPRREGATAHINRHGIERLALRLVNGHGPGQPQRILHKGADHLRDNTFAVALGRNWGYTLHMKAAIASMTTIRAPMASLSTVPQNCPMAAPRPAVKLWNSVRPAHRFPSSAPTKAPRQAPNKGPTSGTGSAIPMIPPTILPMSANT